MSQARERYISYLVRLWLITDGGEPVWRASIERAGTRERKGFPDLSALCAFLENEVRQATKDRAVQNAIHAPASRQNQRVAETGPP